MSINLAQLASQGRAYSPARAWEVEELEALLILEKDRALSRLEAADYVRNGILSVEAFDAAQGAKFKPKSIEDAHLEVEASIAESGKAFGSTKKKAKSK